MKTSSLKSRFNFPTLSYLVPSWEEACFRIDIIIAGAVSLLNIHLSGW